MMNTLLVALYNKLTTGNGGVRLSLRHCVMKQIQYHWKIGKKLKDIICIPVPYVNYMERRSS